MIFNLKINYLFSSLIIIKKFQLLIDDHVHIKICFTLDL